MYIELCTQAAKRVIYFVILNEVKNLSRVYMPAQERFVGERRITD
jgi:hypothetical protein